LANGFAVTGAESGVAVAAGVVGTIAAATEATSVAPGARRFGTTRTRCLSVSGSALAKDYESIEFGKEREKKREKKVR
jgi:hypothetical protein